MKTLSELFPLAQFYTIAISVSDTDIYYTHGYFLRPWSGVIFTPRGKKNPFKYMYQQQESEQWNIGVEYLNSTCIQNDTDKLSLPNKMHIYKIPYVTTFRDDNETGTQDCHRRRPWKVDTTAYVCTSGSVQYPPCLHIE